MTTLYITEFANNALANTVAAQPPSANQTVAIGGTSTASSAFQNNTALIRLQADSICSVAFGTSPTATVTTQRMAANQTEYFTVPMGSGYKVATITNT